MPRRGAGQAAGAAGDAGRGAPGTAAPSPPPLPTPLWHPPPPVPPRGPHGTHGPPAYSPRGTPRTSMSLSSYPPGCGPIRVPPGPSHVPLAHVPHDPSHVPRVPWPRPPRPLTPVPPVPMAVSPLSCCSCPLRPPVLSPCPQSRPSMPPAMFTLSPCLSSPRPHPRCPLPKYPVPPQPCPPVPMATCPRTAGSPQHCRLLQVPRGAGGHRGSPPSVPVPRGPRGCPASVPGGDPEPGTEWGGGGEPGAQGVTAVGVALTPVPSPGDHRWAQALPPLRLGLHHHLPLPLPEAELRPRRVS